MDGACAGCGLCPGATTAAFATLSSGSILCQGCVRGAVTHLLFLRIAEPQQPETVQTDEALLSMPIREWVARHDQGPLGTRVIGALTQTEYNDWHSENNVLIRDDGSCLIPTLGHLVALGPGHLLTVPNLGRVTIAAIERWLKADGFRLRSGPVRSQGGWWARLRNPAAGAGTTEP